MGTKVTQESGLEISEHHHTSSEMVAAELKELKVISEKTPSKSKKKPAESNQAKVKRLVKVKRTPSSSSESSASESAVKRAKPTQRLSKTGPADSAVGSMIQYDADVESLDRGQRRRASDGTIESDETEQTEKKETKRYLPDSYNESDEEESEDSLSFDEYDEVEESIVIQDSNEDECNSPNSRTLKRTHSDKLPTHN